MREERGPEPRRPDEEREPTAGSSVAVYAGLGLQFAVAILVFLYLGQWLDRRFGTEPWLLLISVFLGAGGSLYSIYRKLMADLRRQEERRSR
ncbi:MAG TPA: AtpZ/AtpI family protein [Gemmatimonadaceae bacterium]|nr:AtpZ/AtpI family protein [Gemmatimonadaceae bacterium]